MSEGLYEIESLAGSGGHAIVAFARVRGRGDRVALKVLRRELANDAALVARFADEARMLVPIHHPDVIRVYRLLDYAGRPVIEMEPVHGLSVEVVLGNLGGPLPLADALEIVRRTAAALHAVYAGPYGRDGQPMRVIHRDVKPANLLLSRDGKVKVVDFGTAKGEFDGRRAKSMFFSAPGSAGFVAPERRLGIHDHPASDVYALGLALFLLVTGKVLVISWDGDKGEEGAKRQLAHLPLPALVPLVARMIAFDHESRPTMGEVAEELQALMRAEKLAPDLPALAAAQVVPVLDRKRGRSLTEDLAAMAFLETELPSDAPSRLSKSAATAAVRRLLASKGWEQRVPELERIVEAAEGGFEEPLLAVLQRARPRWWTPWVPRARPEELVAALWVLGDHPSAAVKQSARNLVNHPEDRVRRAARFVVTRS